MPAKLKEAKSSYGSCADVLLIAYFPSSCCGHRWPRLTLRAYLAPDIDSFGPAYSGRALSCAAPLVPLSLLHPSSVRVRLQDSES